jgi:hypothetical protein
MDGSPYGELSDTHNCFCKKYLANCCCVCSKNNVSLEQSLDRIGNCECRKGGNSKDQVLVILTCECMKNL